jgi:signal transduction histidine kinase
VVGLNTIITGAHDLLAASVRQVDLQFKLGELPPAIKADPGRLEEVLFNLAVNARDAIPRGGVLTISAS